MSSGRKFVDGEGGDDERQQEDVDSELVSILSKYRGTIRKTIERIEDLDIGQASQRDMLIMRWRQIGSLIDKTVDTLKA